MCEIKASCEPLDFNGNLRKQSVDLQLINFWIWYSSKAVHWPLPTHTVVEIVITVNSAYITLELDMVVAESRLQLKSDASL